MMIGATTNSNRFIAFARNVFQNPFNNMRKSKVFLLIFVGIVVFGGLFWFMNSYIREFLASIPIAKTEFTSSAPQVRIEDEFSINMQLSGETITAADVYITYSADKVVYMADLPNPQTGFHQLSNYFDTPPIIEEVSDNGDSTKTLHLVLVSEKANSNVAQFSLRFKALQLGEAVFTIDTARSKLSGSVGADLSSASYISFPQGALKTTVLIAQDGGNSTPTPTVGADVTNTPTPPNDQDPTVTPGPTETTGLPDLTVEDLTYSFPYYRIQYCNRGTAQTQGQIQFAITDKNSGHTSNFIPERNIPAVNECQWTFDLACNFLNPNGTAGGNCDDSNKHIQLTIDPTNAITETNEQNNSFEKKFPDSGNPNKTPTLAPTSIEQRANVTLDIKTKLQGVVSQPKEQYRQLSMKVMVISTDKSFRNEQVLPFVVNGDGVWTSNMSIVNTPTNKSFYIYIKGAKHLQRKVCTLKPTESLPGQYNCNNQEIKLAEGANTLDMTSIYLLAGDIPVQNGIIDAADIVFIRSNLGKTDPATLLRADLNLDGIVDTQDYTLVITALGFKYDED